MRPESNFLLCMAVAAFLAAGASPANAACTVPNILSNGQTADAIQLMQDFSAVAGCVDAISPTGTPNSLQFKTNTGSLAGLPLAAGQLPVGTGGAAPQGKALTAGPGIAITTAPGNITIAATSSGSANGVDWLNEAAVVRPSVAAFSLLTSTNAPAGAALVSTSRGMALTTSANANATSLMGETPTPSGRWQATMLAIYSGPLTTFNLPAIAVRDSINRRAVEFGIGGASTSGYLFAYTRTIGGHGLDTILGQTTTTDVGLPPPSQPIWSRLTYDGTNLSWSFSRDGEVFSTAFTVLANDSLTNLDRVGPATLFQQPAQAAWPSAYHILSWQLVSL
ncbi:hypothetical protein GYN07_25525 (plasmid) [Rhizobium leguminosarum bv. viciae 248]|uniref:hypothetical protein n=1 Tax=Rhizobium leguminosarum TaxID=384 RepID=UPI00039D9448|nr:hypothetical protein [Rhizobium leguminosarum]MCA2406288.1 hypothetical protein [Rhizobium leguminosarum]NKM59752.1 hypothetical protein [Rhizobium leguminosarum bv. viciae]QHW27697.1 hypothetical protein GYN07_25525 [Rhizobium leguminosarum bv. viciae 248]